MKQSIEDYFKDIPTDDHPVCEDNIFLHHDLFTDMMTEAVCIIDFQKRNFYDVANHNFFLCGYPKSEVKRMGYQFFDKIIHPDDILLWVKMHNIILKYLQAQDFEAEEGHYFSFTFRIKSNINPKKAPYYMMSDIRLKPVFVDHGLKYGLCLFTASSVKTSGNLRVYFKRESILREYSFIANKWIDRNMLKLSLREREILMLTQQGLSRKEAADLLYVSVDTIKNTITKLFSKNDIKKMIQAEKFTRIHRLIY